MRHNALFRRFISALTRGGPGGMPRPIEVHAHDPLRYVGDMLGWLHQVWKKIDFYMVSASILHMVIFIFSNHLISFTVLIMLFFSSCRPWHQNVSLCLLYLILTH